MSMIAVSKMRTWKDVRKEHFTPEEIEQAYSEIIDEMKDKLARAEAAIDKANESLLNLNYSTRSQPYTQFIDQALEVIATYKADKDESV